MNEPAGMSTSVRIDAALTTLKGIFLEIPGATLDVRHACRLTGLDTDTCLALLLALERARFLRQSSYGQFSLRADWIGPES